MYKWKTFHIITIVIILSIQMGLFADIKLPAVISDNMALQQNAKVKLWGWAEPEEKIKIKPEWYKAEITETVAGADGRWAVAIKTPKAGGPYKIYFQGRNTLEVKNIIIGEVWLCSGQSNMEMVMNGWEKQPIHGGAEDIRKATNSSIRLFQVFCKTADVPLEDVVGQWVECSPETVCDFSAVGYYFGQKINNETGYPVGLICASRGGSLIQAWTRIDFMSNDDFLVAVIEQYNTKRKSWEESCIEAEKSHKPKPIPYFVSDADKPASLYNGMIAPITSMTIKGIIWYQGESDTNETDLYKDHFYTMIMNWRCDFDNYQMPFYFVQLSAFTEHNPGIEVRPYRGQPRNHKWAEIREAQLVNSYMKNTGMAVTIDIGESNNIHPGNKKDVGERIALWALANNYGKNIEYSGPIYAGYKIENNIIRIMFNHAESGLVFKNEKPVGFTIAGQDRRFIPGDAMIDGTTIVVSSNEIKEPVAVRYAWDIDPESSLYNKANLPASPFRTDNWKNASQYK